MMLELELELMLMLMLMLELDAGWLVVFEKTSARSCAGRINFSCRVEVAGRFTSVDTLFPVKLFAGVFR
jgi:hypothetical protein